MAATIETLEKDIEAIKSQLELASNPMADEKRMEMVMGLIMHGGSIKGYALQAIKAAREGDFDAAKNFLQQSADEDKLAHDSQTEMLTKAAQGEPVPIDIYMVHAQDHVMTGIATRDLAVEMVALYQKLADENK